MIKAIIGQMARHDDKPSDTERGLIDRAVTTVWNTLGSGGSIEDIAAALEAGGGELGANLATAIAPYCRGGSYGGIFSRNDRKRTHLNFSTSWRRRMPTSY